MPGRSGTRGGTDGCELVVIGRLQHQYHYFCTQYIPPTANDPIGRQWARSSSTKSKG